MKVIKVRLNVSWYAFGVGIFWNARGRELYVFPLPVCGLIFTFAPKQVDKGACDEVA